MALANYTDLQVSIGSWINRTDLAAVIPDFVTIAESCIARDLRLRKQIVSASLSTVANTRGVSLPADWLEFENVSLLITPERQLTYAPVEHLDMVYPNNGTPSTPSLYTIEGDQILFGPTPDDIYTVSILYYARFPALATASTNWLMTNHPDIYLYGGLYEACTYIGDEQRALRYLQLYQRMVADLQRRDDDAQHSGSSLRVRRV